MLFRSPPQRRVNLFVQEQDVGTVVRALCRLDTFDLEATAQDERSRTPERWQELAATYNDQAQRLERLLNMLAIECRDVPTTEALTPGQDAPRLERETQVVEAEVQAWHAELSAAEEECRRLEQLLQRVRLLAPLAVAFQELRQTRYLYLVIGTVARTHLDRLHVPQADTPFVLVPVCDFTENDEQQVLLIAATERAYVPVLERTQQSLFMQPLDLPENLMGTPVQASNELEERYASAVARRDELRRQQTHLVQHWRAHLCPRRRQARENAATAAQIGQFVRYEQFYLITGQVIAGTTGRLFDTVQQVARSPYAIFLTAQNEA